jgi:hypothetical protein
MRLTRISDLTETEHQDVVCGGNGHVILRINPRDFITRVEENNTTKII